MTNLQPLLFTLALSTATLNTQATEPTISQQKQVAGYYQYQSGDVQITALLDGTNFMSPILFKNISQQ